MPAFKSGGRVAFKQGGTVDRAAALQSFMTGAHPSMFENGQPKVWHHFGSFGHGDNHIPDTHVNPIHFGSEKAAEERKNYIVNHEPKELEGKEGQLDLNGEPFIARNREGIGNWPTTKAHINLKNPWVIGYDRVTKNGWKSEIAKAKAKGHDGIVYKDRKSTRLNSSD